MSKRILSLVLAFVMVLGTFGTVFAAEPTGNSKVDWLVEQGYVLGDAGGLRLEDGITRAEVSVIVAKALGLETEAAAMANIPSKFSDMRTAGTAWANGFVNVLNAKGFISGYPDGTFGPANEITYAEVASMLVRVMGGLTEAEAETAVWPTTYLAKAASLGIFDGVTGVDYSAKAVRGKIFEMTYNTLDKEVGNNTVLKAIVLENSRVETIGKNEVVVEVLKVEQVANYTEASRKEKGDQERFVIDEKLGNVEDLLGQVANFTINKEGKVIKITPDTSYKVVTGPATATRNKIEVDGTSYTVELGEGYKGSDDRIFRTYHNDNAFAYRDFFINPLTKEVEDEFEVDYARVTVKNGKVLLIDSFSFDDIAPVKEVKAEGAEVFAYNDSKDGGIKRFDLLASAKVITVKENKFSRATRADIAANDVIHAYKGGYIVRKDAKVEGKYEKISYSKDVNSNADDRVFVNVDGNRYQVLPVVNHKPVYSYDAKQFFTLETKAIDSTLRDFKGEEVTLLLDLSDNLQLMTSELELGEFAAIINNIIGKDVRVLKGSDNTKAEYTATLDSKLKITGRTGHQSLNSYDPKDVVYLSVNDGSIDTMLRLIPATDNGALVKNITSGSTTKKDVNSNYINIDNDKVYRILDRTNVFVRTNGVLKSTTIDDVLSNYKLGELDSVKAVVLSDQAYNSALTSADVNFRRVNSALNNVAHTIVFTELATKTSTYNYEIVKVLEKDASGTDYELKVQFSDNTIAYRSIKSVAAKAAYANVVRGDIVELGVTKDDNKHVYELSTFIPTTAGVYEVTNVSSGTGYRNITLKDATNATKDFWIFGEEFGQIGRGTKVSIYDETDANGHLEVIIERPASSALSYWGGGSAAMITDGVVSSVRTNTLTNVDYIEITKGNIVKEYEVRGLARAFVNTLVTIGDEVKVILDGNYLVGFSYVKLSSARTLNNDLTVPAAWAGFVLDGSTNTITNTGYTFIVDADNATIKNVTFTGDVTVSNRVANDFTANSVIVQGTTIIAGGSSNTVKFNNSTLATVNVTKTNVRIALTGTTAITTLNVNVAGVKVDKDATTTITNVTGNPVITTNLAVGVTGATYAGNKVNVGFTVNKLDLSNNETAVTDVKTKGTVTVAIKDGTKTISTSAGILVHGGNGQYEQELEILQNLIDSIKGKDIKITVTVKYDGTEYKSSETTVTLVPQQ